MAFFIGYSRRDTAAVRILVDDLQCTRHDLCLEVELGGGQLQVLTQLKQALRDEQDPPARGDLVDLLRRLRAHTVDSTRFVAMSWASLVLTLIGAGVATAAVRRGERHGQAAFVLAMLGTLVAVILLARYNAV